MTLPIKYAHYLLNGVKQRFFPITTEEAVYDSSGGGTLKNKLQSFSENFGAPFNKETDYAVGDICIYLNRLYKFTSAKPAGEFDGTKVVPVSLAEMCNRDFLCTEMKTVSTTSGANITIATLTLDRSKTYLVFGFVDSSVSDSSTYGAWLGRDTSKISIIGNTSRGSMASGGGLLTMGVFNLGTHSTGSFTIDLHTRFTVSANARGYIVAIEV